MHEQTWWCVVFVAALAVELLGAYFLFRKRRIHSYYNNTRRAGGSVATNSERQQEQQQQQQQQSSTTSSAGHDKAEDPSPLHSLFLLLLRVQVSDVCSSLCAPLFCVDPVTSANKHDPLAPFLHAHCPHPIMAAAQISIASTIGLVPLSLALLRPFLCNFPTMQPLSVIAPIGKS